MDGGEHCLTGTLGSGARARRIVVRMSDADSARLYLFSRPARELALRREPHSALDGAARVYRSTDGTALLVERMAHPAPGFDLRVAGVRDTTSAVLRQAPPAASVAAASGRWVGAVGPGGTIRLVATVSAGVCGLPIGTFDSPDQGQRDLPLTAIDVVGDSVHLHAEYMDLHIALPMRGGDERTARMTQNGVAQLVRFRRGTSSDRRRPQEPHRPLPYGERTVRFASRATGVDLEGTLSTPVDAGPHPAVVLVSGSGAQDRDETVAGHKPFLVLADHLTRAGYAVLRFDDRGAGGSTGNVLQSGLQDIAADVHGALDFLRTLPGIDAKRIGLLGHSEGGYVAPIVASRDRDVAFLVLLGAPAVKGRDVLAAQATAMSRAAGVADSILRVDSLMRAAVFALFDRRPSDASLEQQVDATLSRWQRRLSPRDRRIAQRLLSDRRAAQDSAALTLWRSRWFKSLYHHDPVPYLRATHAPVLAILGALDLQVPLVQNAPAMRRILGARRDALSATHTLPGVNHMMQPASTGLMNEYIEIEQTIAPEVLVTMDRWLARLFPTAGPATGTGGPESPLTRGRHHD